MTTEITENERAKIDGSIKAAFNSYENFNLTEYASDIFIKVATGHHLINGNKRWAVVTLLYFLELNGKWLDTEQYDLYLLAKLAVDNNETNINRDIAERNRKSVKNILAVYLNNFLVDEQSEMSITISPNVFG